MMAPLKPYKSPVFQVILMQIMYVIAMVAVFVLCAALLSTTRRILRPSSASGFESEGNSAYSMLALDEIPLVEVMPAPETMAVALQRAVGDPFEAPEAEPTAPFNASISAPEGELTRTLVGQPIPNISSAETVYAAAEENAPAREIDARIDSEIGVDVDAQESKGWMHKPSRRTYNRALECLLVGVSAWVLIQTQRSASRYRMAHTAGGPLA
jgi:hypothetical protein